MKRVDEGVTRPAPIRVEVDGVEIQAYPGEAAAVALLSCAPRFRDDRSHRPRGMFCNMGTCNECTVWIARSGTGWRRVRACLVPIEAGMRIQTVRPEA